MTDSQLLAPFRHVASLQSKNLRDSFLDAVNRIVGCPDEAHVANVKLIVSKLHNASLLLDDIEDAAPRRRGQPSAHVIFGTALTMNAANMVVFEVLGDCIAMEARLRSAKVAPVGHTPPASGATESTSTSPIKIFQEELVALHRGQGQDIYWRDTSTCPTLEQYRQMVQDKTGGLFRVAVRLLLAAVDHTRATEQALLEISDKLSYMFQVLDDYLNLASDDYHQKKCYCEDLTEGKFSFLTTHSVIEAAKREDYRLQRMLQTKPAATDAKLFCLQLLHESGSFEVARELVTSLGSELTADLENFQATHEALASAQKNVLLTGRSLVVQNTSQHDEGGDAIDRDQEATRRDKNAGEARRLHVTAGLASFVGRLLATMPTKSPVRTPAPALV